MKITKLIGHDLNRYVGVVFNTDLCEMIADSLYGCSGIILTLGFLELNCPREQQYTGVKLPPGATIHRS